MLGDAVEDIAHRDLHAAGGNLGTEDRGAIGLGEDRLGHVLADLARVDVPGGDDADVAGLIAAQIPVHQADRIVRALAIMGKALNERAGAIANADDGDFDGIHGLRNPRD
jgi:hypothetical protein